jgi:hypothetical protein
MGVHIGAAGGTIGVVALTVATGIGLAATTGKGSHKIASTI